MIKNSFKFIVLIILVIIANACSSNSNSFWGFKPHFSTGTYIHSYAIIEDGKVNRMGIPKKDIYKMDSIINDKYGIQFIDDERIAPKDHNENYRIKFYNDFKMTVNGKEYNFNIKSIEKKDDVIYYKIEKDGELFTVLFLFKEDRNIAYMLKPYTSDNLKEGKVIYSMHKVSNKN